MAALAEPLIHLTVRVLPPKEVNHLFEPAGFLLNLEHGINFFRVWNLVDSRYKRDYISGGCASRKLVPYNQLTNP